MNYDKLTLPLAGVVLFGTLGALRAEDDAWSDNNRVSLGYRMGFNMPLKLKNVGMPAFANNPSANGKSYTDGFVGTDNTGNVGGLTTYWGYNSGTQVTAGNSSLVLHNSSSGAVGPDVDESPYNGMEITFDHEFGRHPSWRWGVEGAFNWMDFSAHQRSVAPAGVLGADSYSLGYTPPSAPYTGPYASGPFSPLLGTTATPVPVTVDSTFAANFYGFRLGPYLDLPLNKHLLLTFSAGLAVTIVDAQFSYIESNPMEGVTSAANASDVNVLAGGYVSALATLKLSPSVNVFAGMQFESSDSYQITAGTKRAEIDLSQALYFSAGLSFSF